MINIKYFVHDTSVLYVIFGNEKRNDQNILSKNDQGFQRKMTALGYRDLPYNICKKGNQYRIQYPERFIYKLFLSQRQKDT